MDTTSKNPLVSIVLASYNGGRFLQEQLDSLVRQTYQNIEIIAVDDCSTDNTVNLLDQYAAKYSHFLVVKNGQNMGHVKTFEKGFALAKGDYIAPCDQDDIWLPTKIEVLIKHIGDHAIAYCDSEFIDGAGQALGKKMSDTKNLTDFDSPLMYIEVGISALGHAILMTKQLALAAMPFPYKFSHDNWLGFVASFNGSVKFVDEVLVQYRRHDSNLTNALHKKDRKKMAGKKGTKQQRIANAQQRLKTLYDKCPGHLPEKEVIGQLYKSHENYSFSNNFLRMRLFFQHRNKILLHKKYRHPELKRRLHCFKAFFKMI
ncbi:MAG: glycosyltransferase family 2 protein [Methylovulum sp.]|nr:glycosyltransferase family 2 protein [Methylovulum sp.]MDD2725315.1 glycosyltransferase family 2 protein [Methylovulum sp.]MDD5125894.1 glycosyltransferase family 2 protein [Methylovulum sp.]